MNINVRDKISRSNENLFPRSRYQVVPGRSKVRSIVPSASVSAVSALPSDLSQTTSSALFLQLLSTTMIRFTAALSLTALFSLSNASDVKILSPNVQDLEVPKVIIHADPISETDLSSPANDIVVGHYGPPPSCDADEQMFQIQGVPGKVIQVLEPDQCGRLICVSLSTM